MKQQFTFIVLTAAVLLVNTSLIRAAKADAQQPADSRIKASLAMEKSSVAGKRKAGAKIGHVDINSAPREQLKKLPGIGDAEADKIIAGRPYLSKANLVTHNIIGRGIYENIKKQIFVKPNKNMAA